jgi:hypothetical protein
MKYVNNIYKIFINITEKSIKSVDFQNERLKKLFTRKHTYKLRGRHYKKFCLRVTDQVSQPQKTKLQFCYILVFWFLDSRVGFEVINVMRVKESSNGQEL